MTPEYGYSPEAWTRAVARMIWRFLLCAAIIVGSIYALWQLKAIIIYLVIAAVFAYIMRPIAGWLARRRTFIEFHNALATVFGALFRPGISLFRRLFRMPPLPARGPVNLHMHTRRLFATLYVLILLFVGSWYAVSIMINPFVHEIKNVEDNWTKGSNYRDRFESYGKSIHDWYEKHVRKDWRDQIEQKIQQNGIQGDLQKQVTEWVGVVAKNVLGWLHNIVEIVLLPVLAFYFALDSRKIKHEFIGLLPPRRRREVCRIIHEFNRIMFSFVVGQAILCTLAGFVVGTGLWLLNVQYPVMLGVLAGITRAIPIIGPIIGGIPIVILALLTGGPGVALGVLAFFTFLHFAESKFVMPMLIGDRMKLHPAVIIIVLLIGQEFGGLLGMFFAAPVAALIRVIMRRYWLRRIQPRPNSPLHLPGVPEVSEAVD